ncbi:CAH14 anhydrase, partial [Indicator maculatus]|nr:CAH14 anhydrase [Indicator maculatus]
SPTPGPHGQQHWPEDHPACGGQAQSPIDIQTQRAQPDPSLPPVRPVGYQHPGAEGFTLANNGHTGGQTPKGCPSWGVPGCHSPSDTLLCWGPLAEVGQVEGVPALSPTCTELLPLQMHVVHYDTEHYTNASEAQHHAGGLAVLGVLLEVGSDPHPAYDNILSHLGSISYAGQTTSIPSFSIQDLLPQRLDLYYRYNGSLTTPPCSQSVLWTVFQQPVHISLAQLEQLQGALYATAEAEPEPQPLVENFREPQELHQRQVLASF